MAMRLPRNSCACIEHRQVAFRHEMRAPQCEQRGERATVNLRCQGLNHGRISPMPHVAKLTQCRRTFLDFTHAFERLVRAQAAQLGEAVDLRTVVEHVAAECGDQPCLVDEWCQCQEYEAAF